MKNWNEWFRYQLEASAEGFLWGYDQIRPALLERLPPRPDYLGTWEPTRHVWHVMEYERWLVIPSMKQWLGGEMPDNGSWRDDDEAWSMFRERDSKAIIRAFRLVRQEQIAMLEEFRTVDWETPRETLWGNKPLSMVVTKTFQHTYEHGDTLLRMYLWWEAIESDMSKKA